MQDSDRVTLVRHVELEPDLFFLIDGADLVAATGKAAAKQQNGGKNPKKFHAFFHGVCPHFSSISMDTMVTGFIGLSAASVSTAAIASTTSMPSNT